MINYILNYLYYKCLPQKVTCFKDFKIESVKRQDIEQIRLWRNNQISFLRQKREITKDEQINYFKKVIFSKYKLNQPSEILLSFKKKNILVGYGGLVHINWSKLSAESSFLLNHEIDVSSSKYKYYIESYFKLIFKIAFKFLHIKKITSETFIDRKKHIDHLENIGFVRQKSNNIGSVFHIYNNYDYFK